MTQSAADPAESDDRVRQAMASIGASARQTNLRRAAVLAEVLDGWGDAGPDDDARERGRAAAHQLVGSAGTFGFPTASRMARDLERFLLGAPQAGGLSLAQARQRLVDLREALTGEPEE